MIHQVAIKEKTVNFEFMQTQKFGGFKSYWSLTRQMYCQSKSLIKILSNKELLALYLSLLAKTPWWTLIKPLGQVFCFKTHYSGTLMARYQNGALQRISYSNPRKQSQYFICGFPVWLWTTSNFTPEDKTLLQEKYLSK